MRQMSRVYKKEDFTMVIQIKERGGHVLLFLFHHTNIQLGTRTNNTKRIHDTQPRSRNTMVKKTKKNI